MKLTLMGPDDNDNWFLSNDDANDWCLVERLDHYPRAATMLGWNPCECRRLSCDHQASDDLIEEVRNFLMENIGENFSVPKHVADYFLELQEKTA